MEVIGLMFSIGMDLLKMDFVVFGYTLSLWNLLIYGVVVYALLWALWRFILHD